MINNAPLISIIIPAFNSGQYLHQTIVSVKEQTYSNWQLIIVNDGSTDNTIEVISQFLNDNRVKLVNQENAGVSAARNKGISLATGDYIAFLDADDAWLPNNIEEKISVLNNSSVDYVFANMYLADEYLNPTGENVPGTDKQMLDKLLLWNEEVIPCPSGNLLLRKNCFNKGLRFDEQFSTAADQDFSIYLALNYSGYYIDKPLMKYRVLPGSMSKNIKLMERDHIGVYRKAEANKLFKSFFFRQKCFANLYLILAGSWWVNGGNKLRGMYFIMCAVITYPFVILKLLKKINK